jgi:hypothetical protein
MYKRLIEIIANYPVNIEPFTYKELLQITEKEGLESEFVDFEGDSLDSEIKYHYSQDNSRKTAIIRLNTNLKGKKKDAQRWYRHGHELSHWLLQHEAVPFFDKAYLKKYIDSNEKAEWIMNYFFSVEEEAHTLANMTFMPDTYIFANYIPDILTTNEEYYLQVIDKMTNDAALALKLNNERKRPFRHLRLTMVVRLFFHLKFSISHPYFFYEVANKHEYKKKQTEFGMNNSYLGELFKEKLVSFSMGNFLESRAFHLHNFLRSKDEILLEWIQQEDFWGVKYEEVKEKVEKIKNYSDIIPIALRILAKPFERSK